MSFPYGLFDFVLTSGAPGSSAVIAISCPAPVPAGAVFWKCCPTPAGNNAAIRQLMRRRNDMDDLTVNGVIVDQGGQGVTMVEIPTLWEWARMLLAMMGMAVVPLQNRWLNRRPSQQALTGESRPEFDHVCARD